jgi:hypothetical protein
MAWRQAISESSLHLLMIRRASATCESDVGGLLELAELIPALSA